MIQQIALQVKKMFFSASTARGRADLQGTFSSANVNVYFNLTNLFQNEQFKTYSTIQDRR